MGNDAEITLAFIFKRSGKQKLKLNELYLPMSMELNWFSPQEAKKFVNQAIEHNLLEEKDGMVSPNFDIEKTKIPVGFRPNQTSFDAKEQNVIKDEKNLVFEMVERISKKSDLDEKKVLDKIKEASQEKNIALEVSALLIAKDYDLVLDAFYDRIEEAITRNKEV